MDTPPLTKEEISKKAAEMVSEALSQVTMEPEMRAAFWKAMEEDTENQGNRAEQRMQQMVIWEIEEKLKAARDRLAEMSKVGDLIFTRVLLQVTGQLGPVAPAPAKKPRIHYTLVNDYPGCDEIRQGQRVPTFGALYATEYGPDIAKAEAGFFFTTKIEHVTCRKCKAREGKVG